MQEPPARVTFSVLQLSPAASSPEDWVDALKADFGTATVWKKIKEDIIFTARPRGLKDGFLKNIVLPFINTIDPSHPSYKEIMDIIIEFCKALAVKLDKLANVEDEKKENRPPNMEDDGVEEVSPGKLTSLTINYPADI